MHLDFSLLHAAITGAASGIGLAAARLLAESGATLYLLDLPGPALDGAALELGASALPCDVTRPESVEAAFARIPRLDAAFLNAGVARLQPLEETTLDAWRQTLDVNLTGVFLTLKAAAALMRPARRGAIVLTASTNSYDGEALHTAYNATKAGVLGLLHTAANELGPWGIRVNAVCPGLIRTPLTQAAFDSPDFCREYFRHIPLGRGGEAREVAAAMAFLAHPASSYVTGATLLVDGGQLACKYATWNEATARFETDHWEIK